MEKRVSLQIMEVNEDVNDVVNLSNDFPATATNVSSFSQKRTLPMPPKEPGIKGMFIKYAVSVLFLPMR